MSDIVYSFYLKGFVDEVTHCCGCEESSNVVDTFSVLDMVF